VQDAMVTSAFLDIAAMFNARGHFHVLLLYNAQLRHKSNLESVEEEVEEEVEESGVFSGDFFGDYDDEDFDWPDDEGMSTDHMYSYLPRTKPTV